jgi:hypothetical protein
LDERSLKVFKTICWKSTLTCGSWTNNSTISRLTCKGFNDLFWLFPIALYFYFLLLHWKI